MCRTWAEYNDRERDARNERLDEEEAEEGISDDPPDPPMDEYDYIRRGQ